MTSWKKRQRSIVLTVLGMLCAVAVHVAAADAGGQWPQVGGNAQAQRYSPLRQIDRHNVAQLRLAWTYRNGDFSKGDAAHGATAFQVTPLMIEDTLYFCTPYNRVIALDAASGKPRWSFDPKTKLNGVYTPTCRGVAWWRDASAAVGTACRDRIYAGTLDARLIALDAASGRRCADFGRNGEVNLLEGLGETRLAEYYMTSAPLVVGDVVATGAFVKDGQRVDAPGGAVRGFDARSGALRWVWDPVPPGVHAVTAAEVRAGATLTRGTPNVWALMSADAERGLIFLPTGGPSPDHYGGVERKGFDYYGTSIVALDAATGKPRWNFQTVHHDVWDYDVAAQPVLYEARDAKGAMRPAVIGATKLGFIFLLDRLTGQPLFPVEERKVPQSTVPGEHSAPTQPFPTRPAPLHPMQLTRENLWGMTFLDKNDCQKTFDSLDYQGPFTPPSFKGSLLNPGLGGGINWGSVSVDPVRNRMIVNLQVAPFIVRLVPRAQFHAKAEGSDLVGVGPQEGTPYVVERAPFLSKFKTPCVQPPWGRLMAIDLNTGNKLWERELGNLNNMAPLVGDYLHWGTPNSGGSLQTGSGLVFIGATMDKYLRAFDADNGEELWHYELPYAAQATPISYQAGRDRKQYIVIAAGGHGPLGTEPGDALMAFTLQP